MDHRKDISEIATGTKRWAVSGQLRTTIQQTTRQQNINDRK